MRKQEQKKYYVARLEHQNPIRRFDQPVSTTESTTEADVRRRLAQLDPGEYVFVEDRGGKLRVIRRYTVSRASNRVIENRVTPR